MSWLTDLAGRAEFFFVKIYKNAAVTPQLVLTKDRITPVIQGATLEFQLRFDSDFSLRFSLQFDCVRFLR